jgi:hypothetical protein
MGKHPVLQLGAEEIGGFLAVFLFFLIDYLRDIVSLGKS